MADKNKEIIFHTVVGEGCPLTFELEVFKWGVSAVKYWDNIVNSRLYGVHRDFNFIKKYPDLDSTIARINSYFKICKNLVKVDWDTEDTETSEDELPEYVILPDDVDMDSDEVAEWLSENFGYCVNSYKIIDKSLYRNS